MTESEIIKLIKNTVRTELAQTLLGFITETNDAYTTSIRRFSTDSEIGNLRIIRPYGMASRAPAGTGTVVHPVNGDPSHLLSLGDYDSITRPNCNSGESALYDAYGHIVYLSQSKMQFGSESSANPMILGDIVQTLFENILDAIANHNHIGNLGFSTSPPINAATFESLKSSPVADGTILSGKCFTEK